MKPIPLYELILDDWTRYSGESIENPGFRKSPENGIQVFKLRLPSGDFLMLQGYDEYNFFIEAFQDISGNKEHHVSFMFLMGCKDNVVTSYRIAAKDFGQYRAGDTTIRQFPKGKEYDGKPTSGWHKGINDI